MLYLYSSTYHGTRVPLPWYGTYTCTYSLLALLDWKQFLSFLCARIFWCPVARVRARVRTRVLRVPLVPWYAIPILVDHGTRTRVQIKYNIISKTYSSTYYMCTYTYLVYHPCTYHGTKNGTTGTILQLTYHGTYCSIPWCLLRPLASVPVAPECLYFKLFLR